MDNSSPAISNCTISGMQAYGLYIFSASSPTITGCTITNNQYGIYVEYSQYSSPIVTGCNITGNPQYGIYIYGSGVYQGNTISGNGYGIYVYYQGGNPLISGNTYTNNTADMYAGGTISGTVIWEEPGHAYRLQGLSIEEGSSLTIPAGSTVKMDGSAQITVVGTLNATGVTFTWADGQNQWGGIWFSGAGASGSRLENCVLEHAYGAYCYYGYGYQGGVISLYQSSPTITGCTISNCNAARYGISMDNSSPAISNCTISGMQAYGLYIFSASSPTITGCTITNNQYGIYVEYSQYSSPIVTGCNITNNQQYGIYNAMSNVIDATNNYWGDPSGPYDPSDDRATGGLYNPDGLGDMVSDHVNYEPWAISPILGDNDSDGITNEDDNCIFKPNGPELGTCSSTSDKPGITCQNDADCADGCSSNGQCLKNQEDSDGDGVGDVCDNCPTNCNSQQLDANGNGIGDVCDTDPGCGGCSGIGCEQEC
jgi:parallel beta-helix repeat protein